MSFLKISLVLVLSVCVISCASTQSKVEKKQAENVKDQYERALVAMNYNLVDQAIMHLNNAISMALALTVFGTDVGMIIAFTGPLTQFPIMIA